MPDDQQIATTSYFCGEFAVQAIRLLPGEFYSSLDSIAITTLLGSCVSVCLYDRVSGVGGMNHFMLPRIFKMTNASRCTSRVPAGCAEVCSARYGSCAMRQLIEMMGKQGADRSRLEAKIFGAGQMMGGEIGAENAAFALGYLAEQGIPLVAKDLGGSLPRKVVFFPATGRVLVKRIPEGGRRWR